MAKPDERFDMSMLPRDPAERFWSKVTKTESCWIWQAGLNAEGYGKFRYEDKAQLAHRVAYQLLIEAIPDGVALDHMCHNADPTCPGNADCAHRACVNPEHLAFATHRQNAARSPLVGSKTHCKQGHPFSDANTTLTTRGARRCKTCHRESASRSYHQRREASL